MSLRRRLLWVDSVAALLAGGATLALSGWLSQLYALPRGVLLTIGAANLAYGAFSGSLARLARRRRAQIVALVVANAAWAGLCWLAALAFAGRASVFGLAHLVGEGLFVGALASLEWRERERLTHAP
jgi:hypothetical protein